MGTPVLSKDGFGDRGDTCQGPRWGVCVRIYLAPNSRIRTQGPGFLLRELQCGGGGIEMGTLARLQGAVGKASLLRSASGVAGEKLSASAGGRMRLFSWRDTLRLWAVEEC